MEEENKKPKDEQKPQDPSSDGIKPDPRLINRVQEGLEESRIRKKDTTLIVRDANQKKEDK